MNADILLKYFDRISEAPDAIPRLRRFILDLAVRGKLVEQDSRDEPAGKLLKRIQAEKAKTGITPRRQGAKEGEKLGDLAAWREGDFEVPPSWERVQLGDVVQYGVIDKVDSNRKITPETWVLDLEDIEKDTSRLLERVTSSTRIFQSTKTAFRCGDVLFGKLRPYLNKVLVADTHGVCTTEIVPIRGYCGMVSEYVKLVLKSPLTMEKVGSLMYGMKMPRLGTSDAVLLNFPLPPLAEQQRIVAKVDELMALCDQLEAARNEREARRQRLTAASLQRLNQPADAASLRADARFHLDNLTRLTTRPEQIKQLRQTILNLAVRGCLVAQDPQDEPASELLKRIALERAGLVKLGRIRKEKPFVPVSAECVPFEAPRLWSWTKIGVAALFTEYGTSQQSHHSELGVAVLKMGDIQDGKLLLGGQKKVPATIDDLPALYLENRDLLYNRTNSAELVGKTGIYIGNDNEYTFASYLIRIRCSKLSTYPEYFNLAMNSPWFRHTQIIPHLKQQCGQANVNGTILKNMLIPLPPLAEQRRIVARVDELMALCDQLEARLTTTATDSRRLLEAVLRDAIMPQAQV